MIELQPPGLPELVQSAQELAQLVDELGRRTRVAVDTESNSLHAYRERVCLIQFSTPRGDFVVDPLALDDLQPLAPLFADPRVEKIFHAAEYDILCLRRDFGYTFASIFDTMQAGRILGRKQAGLDRLLEDKFGITHSKRFQKADWGVRPLSRDLLLYAALDTHYLIPLREILASELQEKDLWQLAQEDFAMACRDSAPKPRHEPAAWGRFRHRRDLTARDFTIAKALMEWRERESARLDRPPFRVLEDEKLIAIAKAMPATLEELRAAGFGAKQSQNWGNDVLRAVAKGMEDPLVPRIAPPSPGRAYLKRLEKLKQWRKKTAAGMDVESDVVLPRSLLLALAERGDQAVSEIMVCSPWRWQRFGDQIVEVLRGASPQKLDAAVQS